MHLLPLGSYVLCLSFYFDELLSHREISCMVNLYTELVGFLVVAVESIDQLLYHANVYTLFIMQGSNTVGSGNE